MRIFCIIILITFRSAVIAQSIQADSTYTENYYYKNGNIRRVVDYCVFENQIMMCGNYFEYDSTGTIIVKGRYQIATDSVDCIDCFYANKIDSTFYKIEKTDCNEIRIGIWYYYHPNGTIKESGSYSEKVHTESTTTMHIAPNPSGTHASVSGPYASGYSFEYLRHGVWNFYNERGELIQQVWYHEGRIIETIIVPTKQ